jgi:hypothetical protein
MTNKDLRDEYTEKTWQGTETHGFFYEDYVLWLEAQILALRIHDVVGRSEQLPCGKCENGLIWSKDRLKAKSCDCGK